MRSETSTPTDDATKVAAESTIDLNKTLDKTKEASENLVKEAESPKVEATLAPTMPEHAANTIDSMGHLISKVKDIVA